jgi:hypothetical protein
MRRLLLLIALALVGAPGASADGCVPPYCGTATVPVEGSPVLHVRPNGSLGPLDAYELATGKRRFSLPMGVLAADGRTFVSPVSLKRKTVVTRYDAHTGARLNRFTIARGWWSTALSPNGRFLIASRGQRKPQATHIVIADVVTGRVLHRLRLMGNLTPEALSNDGLRLFLVQYLRRGYVVRMFDLTNGHLRSIRAGADPVVMRGSPFTALAAPDGRRLFTLYFEPDGDVAVHTLDFERGRAACIDIPGGEALAQQRYALALAPGGKRLFATNPALGVVAEIDVAREEVTNVLRFPGFAVHRLARGSTAVAWRTAVHFSDGKRLWTYANGRVGPARAGGGRVIGLGLRRDRLLVVLGNGRGTRLEPAV